jgi:serine/threonine protein kinase
MGIGKTHQPHRVLNEKTRGGMSVLYEVRQDPVGTHHLLKVPDFTGYHKQPEILKMLWKRFRREVRILHAIHHTNLLPGNYARLRDNVVRITGWDHQWDPEKPHQAYPRFYVMEKINGEDLSQLLLPEVALIPLTALKIMYLVVAALAVYGECARRLDPTASIFSHRDLKPENIMIEVGVALEKAEYSDIISVKLMDFGIAKLAEEHTENLTVTGDLLGTPGWIAPETIGRTKYADQRSDIFVAAAILWRLLTGREPFNWNDPQQKALFFNYPEGTRQLIDWLRNESYQGGDKLQGVWDVVFKAMECDPQKRYQTYDEFAIAIYHQILFLKSLEKPDRLA